MKEGSELISEELREGRAEKKNLLVLPRRKKKLLFKARGASPHWRGSNNPGGGGKGRQRGGWGLGKTCSLKPGFNG